MDNKISTNDLLDSILGDAARPSKFRAEINFPSAISQEYGAEKLDILLKSTAIPGRKTDSIIFMYLGKPIPIKGQTKYDQNIDMSFYLEENHGAKFGFEKWIDSLDNFGYSESSDSVSTSNGQYRGEVKIYQYDFNTATDMICYTLYNVFPDSISTVELNSESTGAVSDVTVSFSFSHYDVEVLSENKIDSGGNFGFLQTNSYDNAGLSKYYNWSGGNPSFPLQDILGSIGFDTAASYVGGVTSSIGSVTKGLGRAGGMMGGLGQVKSVGSKVLSNPTSTVLSSLGLNKTQSNTKKLKSEASDLFGGF